MADGAEVPDCIRELAAAEAELEQARAQDAAATLRLSQADIRREQARRAVRQWFEDCTERMLAQVRAEGERVNAGLPESYKRALEARYRGARNG